MESSDVYDYDVFLSFRGPDARQGFADVLCYHMEKAGIRVFRDDDELDIGDKIKKILRALNNSQLCVPIFSETFASSKWCLRELRMMSKLKKQVVPIFYKVTPDDVKLKTSAYQEFLMEHRNIYGEKKVEKWKDALKSSAQFKGMEVLNTRYTKFCEEFVHRLLVKLRSSEKFDIDDLIGVENQIECIVKLLDMESVDVRYLGIYGMGGIGKTTLAKVIYDRWSASFDCCGFIEDIRESSERHGLNYLEKQLLNNLDPKSNLGESYSLKVLKQGFRKKKALIILDDVDKCEQVEKLAGKSSWFGPGSRIILTTRNMNVLKKCRALDKKEVWHYQMDMLDHNNALRLFSRCAFRKDHPPVDFESISKEAISTCGGLPLALVVIGTLLYNEGKRIWDDVIAKSKKIPVQEVKQRLKISYDKLDHDQQQIFLDIACLPVCMDKSKAYYMWEACRFFPGYGLEVLKSMSLIKIKGEDKIWMHDQLRDLGKDIVRGESVHPRKRSRVWEHDDALKVIMSKKSKVNVQALCLDKSCKVNMTQEELASFENLRFLQLNEATFQGELDHLLPELKWLSWKSRSRFEATNFTASSLVNLDLSSSSITENWCGWSILKSAKVLRVLDLSGCLKLTRTPQFPENMILEKLILKRCKRLVMIDGSIGNLKCLVHLELEGCKRLCGLPAELRSLVKLSTLSIHGCSMIKKLPSSLIGQLNLLVELNMSFTAIRKLPESIGELVQLKRLSLAYSKLRELPPNIGALASLVSFNLAGTKIVELPSSIGGLRKLESLCVWDCQDIKMLPDSIAELKSLVRLNLAETCIVELPTSIGRLGKLEELHMNYCSSLRTLPRSVGELKSLVIWKLRGSAITELPESIGGLKKLTLFDARFSSIAKLPSSIIQLPLLENLDLESCNHLIELPELPTSLATLRLPNIAGLPADFWSLSQLKSLELDCRNLKYSSELPCSLTALSLEYVNSETNPPCLSNLKSLEHLKLYKWSKNDGFASLGLEDLDSLSSIQVVRCSTSLMSGLSLLKNLKSLVIMECDYVRKLPDMSGLRNLAWLYLERCQRLTEIPGLGNLKCLKSLEITGCNSLKEVENVSRLKELKEIEVIDCEALTCIPGIDRLRLERFYCRTIERNRSMLGENGEAEESGVLAEENSYGIYANAPYTTDYSRS